MTTLPSPEKPKNRVVTPDNGRRSATVDTPESIAAAASRSHAEARADGMDSIAAAAGHMPYALTHGPGSVAVAVGEDSCATAGHPHSAAVAIGPYAAAAAGPGGLIAIFGGDPPRWHIGIAGENGIDPDTYYEVDPHNRLTRMNGVPTTKEQP